MQDIIPADVEVGVVEDEESQQNPGTGVLQGEEEGEVMETGVEEGGKKTGNGGKEGEDKT